MPKMSDKEFAQMGMERCRRGAVNVLAYYVSTLSKKAGLQIDPADIHAEIESIVINIVNASAYEVERRRASDEEEYAAHRKDLKRKKKP